MCRDLCAVGCRAHCMRLCLCGSRLWQPPALELCARSVCACWMLAACGGAAVWCQGPVRQASSGVHISCDDRHGPVYSRRKRTPLFALQMEKRDALFFDPLLGHTDLHWQAQKH